MTPPRKTKGANARQTVPPEQKPTTLKEAHDLMMRLRPRQDAPLPVWLEYRQRSAKLYAEIADIDRYHHHEARYWAEAEQETANNIAAQINVNKSANEPPGQRE